MSGMLTAVAWHWAKRIVKMENMVARMEGQYNAPSAIVKNTKRRLRLIRRKAAKYGVNAKLVACFRTKLEHLLATEEANSEKREECLKHVEWYVECDNAKKLDVYQKHNCRFDCGDCGVHCPNFRFLTMADKKRLEYWP